MKPGLIAEDDQFDQAMVSYVTDHYRSVNPCLSKLLKVVFPGGKKMEE